MSTAVTVQKPEAIAPANTNTEVQPIRPLFDDTIFINSPNVTKAFGLKPVLAKDGKTAIGGNMRMLGRKEAAAAFDLKGKDNAESLTEAIRTESVNAFKMVRAWIMTRNAESTGLVRMGHRLVGKDGVPQHTLVIRDMPPRDKAILEKFAEAHGVKVEELADFIEKMRAKNPVNVSATVTTSEVKK